MGSLVQAHPGARKRRIEVCVSFVFCKIVFFSFLCKILDFVIFLGVLLAYLEKKMYFCSKTTGKPYSEYECHKKNNAKLVILIKEMT